ncbi:MAG TPA: hypothetical protein VK619_16725 [Pyrinomonadaceae bacterium]|nr:hypothetical protein [Pyrinomonadaceae bacterium]
MAEARRESSFALDFERGEKASAMKLEKLAGTKMLVPFARDVRSSIQNLSLRFFFLASWRLQARNYFSRKDAGGAKRRKVATGFEIVS